MRTDAEDPLILRRDALRRIVYGTPDPSAAAIGELVEVEAELAVRDADVRGDRRAPASSDASGDASRPDHPKPGTRTETAARFGHSARGPLPRWVLVGAAAVALMAAAIVLDPVRIAMSPPRGLEIFDHLQPAYQRGLATKVAESAQLQSSSPAGMRSLGRVFGYEFWVHRDGEAVCLLSRRDFWFDWVDACVGLDTFSSSGLTRAIPADELSDRARSRAGISPDEVVVVRWGADSLDIEWSIVSAGRTGHPGDRERARERERARDLDHGRSLGLDDFPTTYGEWSSSRIAGRQRGS